MSEETLQALREDVRHVVGNAVFAIETNLVALGKRLKALASGPEAGFEEGEVIVENIQDSLEKVKEYLATGKFTPEPHLPRRFRIREEAYTDRKFDASLRYGVYFPGTDLIVNDMGGRGTGASSVSEWADWLDPPPGHLGQCSR